MDKRELLTKELLRCKEEGLRVYINKPDEHNTGSYGLMTDGKSVVYVQFDDYGSQLLRTFFEYVPSRKCGTGCATLDEGFGYRHLSKGVFDDAVSEGKRLAKEYGVVLYRDADHFFEDEFHRRNYEEL